MKRFGLGLGVVFAAAMSAATPVHAQDLQYGIWTGTLAPPNAEALPVNYRVGEMNGELSIVMNNEENGDMAFNEPRVEGDQLTFWWEPGIHVDCVLMRQEDGSFEGTCSAGNGSGAIRMVPPAI